MEDSAEAAPPSDEEIEKMVQKAVLEFPLT